MSDLEQQIQNISGREKILSRERVKRAVKTLFALGISILWLLFFLLILTGLWAGIMKENLDWVKVTLKATLGVIVVGGILEVVFYCNRKCASYPFSKNSSHLASFLQTISRMEKNSHRVFHANESNIFLSGGTLLFTLLLLELFFKFFPHVLPPALGNCIASGYHAELFGIYEIHPEMKMFLMRPNYEREMYFNRYRWHHKTDSKGFRNPVEHPYADVLLLGDSMIYGHGLKETSTIRHYLEAKLQRPVVNLGMQGSSIHQEYQILKRFGRQFQPEVVFLFFLYNDIEDLNYLNKEEKQKFLSSPVNDHETLYFNVIPFETNPFRRHWLDILKYCLWGSRTYKAFVFLINSLRMPVSSDSPGSNDSLELQVPQSRMFENSEKFDDVWQSLPLFRDNPELVLSMQFHLYALRKIQNLADTDHFRFVHVFIYTGMAKKELIYEKILRTFCKTQGIGFFSLKENFQVAIKQNNKLFLEGDGHFSDTGARITAQVLYEEFFKESK